MNQRQHCFKKIVSIVLAIVIGVGTPLAVDMSGSYLSNKFSFDSVLSAYAADIVDTEDAIGISTDIMKADPHVIDLVNEDGSNTIYLFSEPISYVDENGNLKTKDITVEEQNDEELKDEGFDYTNGQNDYRIHFSTNSDKCLKVEFDGGTYSLRPRTLYTVDGQESIAEYLNETFEVFEYPDLYGKGTNLRFYPQLNGVKDDIVLSENIGMNSFSFLLSTENCSAVKNEDGTVSLIKDETEEVVQVFAAPFAYDSVYIEGYYDEHYSTCEYTLEKLTANTYILTVEVDENWLSNDSTVYPVIIDPTTSKLSNSKDAGVYSKKADIPYGTSTTCCFGRTSTYGYGRALSYFSVPSAIKKGAKINSAYLWERETTGETATTYVRPHLARKSWVESEVTWSTRPYGNTEITLPRRNINGNSSDADSKYWFKFDIAAAVKAWVDGTCSNYGIVFISEEEEDKEYQWRAFAAREHGTSSYRPYTVISYTNDATAPTASVTASASSWTMNNVTLTVKSAKDNSGGVGLPSKPYSFSTKKGSYSWQSGASKTFSASDTIYVYVRDAYSNVRLVGTKTIKIDKTKPAKCTVTGIPTTWTNQNYTLTATSSDAQSGITAYSFSTTKGSYSWQTSGTKTLTGNGTYYVYAKNGAGNISDVQTVTINKVDKVIPSTPNVTGNVNTLSKADVVLTATATDASSGVLAYSYSTEPGVYQWQTAGIKTIKENTTVYVYAKDRAGNISLPQTVVVDKIDKVTYENLSVSESTDEVAKEVVLTVNGASSIQEGDWLYSFSTEKEVYNWQEENSTAIRENGTIYVYAKDPEGTIILLEQLYIGIIDNVAPEVTSEEPVVNGTETTITVTATDNFVGELLYSYDGGVNWVTTNVHTLETGSVNTLQIQVKDEAGNIGYHTVDLVKPQFYRDGELVGLYNPVLGATVGMQYKIGSDGEWMDYKVPFAIPPYEETVVYARTSDAASVTTGDDSNDASAAFTATGVYVGAYSESNTDFSFAYKGVSLDFVRSYNSVDNHWFLSTDSHVKVETESNDYLKKAVLTDGSELTFIKTGDNTYLNEAGGYLLTVLADDVGYKLEVEDLTYYYDTAGLLHKIENAYGAAITITRNTSSIVIADGADRSYTLTLDGNGNEAQITDPEGGIIQYDYDEAGQLLQVTDQAGVTIGKYAYTEGILTKSMDKAITYTDGKVTRYTYDSGATVSVEYEGNTITTSDSAERTTSTTYDDAFTVISETDEDENTMEYTYDESHRVLTETTDGTMTAYTYDDKGNLLSSKTGEGEEEEETTYRYDEYNRLICEITAEGATYYVYNDLDEVILSATLKEDYEGTKPEAYDAALDCFDTVGYSYTDGMLTEAIESKNAERITYEYDIYGNQSIVIRTSTQETEQKVERTEYTYDKNGNVLTVRVRDVNGEISTLKEYTDYVYDAAGRVLLVNENGDCTRTIYDNLGRVIQEIGPEDYDEAKDGLQADVPTNTYTDEVAGHTYVYNDVGLLTSETDRLGKTTTYVYNENGNKEEEAFDIYRFYYTNHGEVSKAEINEVVVITYDYNADYEVTSETYANGDVIEYAYNDGKLTKELRNGTEVVTYTYVDGELSEKTDIEAGLVYKYGDNNLVEVCRKLDGAKLYSYTEEQQSEEAQEDTPIITTETHFENGYTKEAGETSVKYIFTGYNTSFVATKNEEDGKVVSDSVLYGSEEKLKASYVYDGEDRITEKQYYDGDLNFVNTYDEEDRIATHGYADTQWNYLYDEHSQLTRVNSNFDNGYTTLYNYDERGNILSKKKYALTEDDITDEMVPTETKTFTYEAEGWNDLLVQVDDKTLTYDQNGNVLTYGDRTFTWERGRILSQITEGENTYSYTYDTDGIRTSKTVNGTTTYYNTEDGVILSQSDGTDTMLFQYDSNGAVAGFNHITKDENDQDVVKQYYYITNQMGDVCGITDASGNLIATYKYDEWGNLLAIETAEAANTQQLAIAETNPFRYKSYYYDVETGYYYLQSRYYDAGICRFINADTVELAGVGESVCDINLFAYCNNNPTNNKDICGYIGPGVIFDVIVALLGQYTGDIIKNVINGKTGTKIFVPCSSVFTYVLTATSSVFGCSSWKKALAKSVIVSAIAEIEKIIKKPKNIVKHLVSFVKSVAICFVCEFVALQLGKLKPKKLTDFMRKFLRKKNLNDYTIPQLQKEMNKKIKKVICGLRIWSYISTALGSVI